MPKRNTITLLGEVAAVPKPKYTPKYHTTETWLYVNTLTQQWSYEKSKVKWSPLSVPVRLRGADAEHACEHITPGTGVYIEGQIIGQQRYYKDNPNKTYLNLIIDCLHIQYTGQVPLLEFPSTPTNVMYEARRQEQLAKLAEEASRLLLLQNDDATLAVDDDTPGVRG